MHAHIIVFRVNKGNTIILNYGLNYYLTILYLTSARI